MTAFLKPALSALLLGGLVLAAAQPPKPRARPHIKHPARAHQLDINTATKAQLASIPGLNEALAAQIIAHRPYLTKEHLVLNGVLPQPLFLSIRDRLTCVPPGVRKGKAAPPKPGRK
jgi:hypothetical protein